MQALRMIKEIADGLVQIRVPKRFGKRVEIIVMPVDEEDQVVSGIDEMVCERLSEEEAFLAASYQAVTEDDEEENAIWRKYIK